jgi:hypothetical protein
MGVCRDDERNGPMPKGVIYEAAAPNPRVVSEGERLVLG